MLNFFKKKPKTYDSELKELGKEYPDMELSKKYNLLKNDLDLKYKKIDEYEHDKNQINIMSSEMKDIDVKIDYLKCELKHNKIDALEYEKRLNDLYQKPWAKIHLNYNEDDDPANMEVEIIYNDYFIKKLKQQGYSGESNDDMVQSWLKQVFVANIDSSDLSFDDVEQPKQPNYVKHNDIEKGKRIVG